MTEFKLLREFTNERIGEVSRKQVRDFCTTNLELMINLAAQFMDTPNYAHFAHNAGEMLVIIREECSIPPEDEGDKIDKPV